MKTVVYIDDDPDDLIIFEEILLRIKGPYQVITSDDAKNAIISLGTGRLVPNIIFLDVNMPLITGKDALQLIRSNPSHSHIPIIMYSTSITNEDKKLFSELGANGFLQKAHQLEEMVREVGRVLKQFVPTS